MCQNIVLPLYGLLAPLLLRFCHPYEPVIFLTPVDIFHGSKRSHRLSEMSLRHTIYFRQSAIVSHPFMKLGHGSL